MAELQDTHIHGDLAVDGSISPWGGAQSGLAFIGTRMMTFNHGVVNSNQSAGSKTFSVNVVDGTDSWVPIYLGCSYGNPYSITYNSDLVASKQIIMNCMNLSNGSHTLWSQWLIVCFKNL